MTIATRKKLIDDAFKNLSRDRLNPISHVKLMKLQEHIMFTLNLQKFVIFHYFKSENSENTRFIATFSILFSISDNIFYYFCSRSGVVPFSPLKIV